MNTKLKTNANPLSTETGSPAAMLQTGNWRPSESSTRASSIAPTSKKTAVEVPEVLAIVFHFLSNRDVGRLRLVSKSWNMTGHDAILSRSRNLLQLVLVVADVASSTQSPTNSKYSSVTPDLIKAALELCVAKYGLDEQSRSVQAEISEVVSTHPIVPALCKSLVASHNVFLVPVALQCADHSLSADGRSLVRTFKPLLKTNTAVSSSSSSFSSSTVQNYLTSPSRLASPHFIADTNYLSDSSIHALVSVHHRRGSTGGLQYTIRCLTGSPAGATGVFSRDTRSFLMDHGLSERVLGARGTHTNAYCLPNLDDALLREGFIGSVREGCFGADFVALFSLKQAGTGSVAQTAGPAVGSIPVSDTAAATRENVGMAATSVSNNYESYVVNAQGELVPVVVESTAMRRQCLYLDSLHVTDAWLANKSDPSCQSTPASLDCPGFSRDTTKYFSPLGSVYCRKKWLALSEKCALKGLNLERAGYTDKTLFYLRKYIFSNDRSASSALGHALKLIMYVWADKLSYFLDHDFKNKMKQADIISKMTFEPEVMFAHLQRLRQAAVDKYLENPVGIKYLEVTGFAAQVSNANALFSHLSLPEVHTTRSKSFHDKVTRCLNMDTFDLFES